MISVLSLAVTALPGWPLTIVLTGQGPLGCFSLWVATPSNSLAMLTASVWTFCNLRRRGFVVETSFSIGAATQCCAGAWQCRSASTDLTYRLIRWSHARRDRHR
jgi:hypothetical protein